MLSLLQTTTKLIFTVYITSLPEFINKALSAGCVGQRHYDKPINKSGMIGAVFVLARENEGRQMRA